ncbi:hypothetical protein OHR68_19750 [Spirillospora sp. NBC_00431]
MFNLAVPSATADPRPLPSDSPATSACKLKSRESVKIRKSWNINSTALGLLPKGKVARSGCITEINRGKYSLCGRQGWRTWRWVEYAGLPRGWVPYACVNPV